MLFCDLVGSTSLAACLDPEDLRDLVRAYHARCEEIVRRGEGSVAQYLGDGVMARFGYPVAHEDDAERAIRCGLEMIAAVRELGSRGGKLEVRVGIATGVVVVGDQLGSEPTQERAAVGETPNLAARLQSLARPGCLVIADRTKRLVGNLFDCRDMGCVALKGYGDPVRAWHVLGLGMVENRFEALRSVDAPLIGREEEIELLRRHWMRAKGGQGRTILISGEPGIGKSRLVTTFQDEIAAEPHTLLQYFFSPYHQTSALYPIINQLGHAARFERDDDADARLAKLNVLLARTSTTPEDTALIADLLSLPLANPSPIADLSPQQRRNKTLHALVRQLQALSRAQPVLLAFEDAHWSDPSSREFLDLVIESIQELPALLVVTFRPEFEPLWTGLSRVSTLVLSQLDRRDGAALVRCIGRDDTLSYEVIDDIVKRTSGVPLFVEELTKLVLETQLRRQHPITSVAIAPSSGSAIPPTLQGSLLARLDHLGPAKDIAQIAAAIGREFSFDILCAVADRTSEEIRVLLDALVDAGLIFRSGVLPRARYFFKHVLIQDTAHGTLLRRPRQRLHARIAEVLERYAESEPALPEVLAQHYEMAELHEKAVMSWRAAGERAMSRSSATEAIEQFTNALKALTQLPHDRKVLEIELDLHLTLGRGFISVKGEPTPEVRREHDRARELALELDQPDRLFQAMGGLWVHFVAKGELELALQIAQDMVARGEQWSHLTGQAMGHGLLAVTRFWRGEFTAARQDMTRSIALRGTPNERDAVWLAGHDLGTGALIFSHRILVCLGYVNKAREAADSAIARATALNDPATLAFAYANDFYTRWMLRDEIGMVSAQESRYAVALKHDILFYAQKSGWLEVIKGYFEQGIRMMRDDLNRASGHHVRTLHHLMLIASVHLMARQSEEGLETVAEALSLIETTGLRWCEAEMYRLKGELLLCAPAAPVSDAEACFERAIPIAQEQSAKFWELRATTSLARLWQSQGRIAEARGRLAPVFDWFTEGFDIPDLKDAKAILESSSG